MGLFSSKQTSSLPEDLRYATVQGNGARDYQQDSFAVKGEGCGTRGTLAVVADGMGGLVNSGQLSNAVTKAISDAFVPGASAPARDQLFSLTRTAIQTAAELTKGLTYQTGTTMVCCLMQNNGLSWMSIGDSRVCLWRNGGLIQLNREHDFARELSAMLIGGSMTPEQIEANPRKEALTSFIGAEFPRYFDYNPEPVPLLPGDRIILMSDGVYRTLSSGELSECLMESPRKCASLLEKRILEKNLPQQDNFTAVVLKVY